jgi:hypothetical protein
MLIQSVHVLLNNDRNCIKIKKFRKRNNRGRETKKENRVTRTKEEGIDGVSPPEGGRRERREPLRK